MILPLLVGFALAYVGALPVAGPVAVLIAERALTGRRRAAWALALGAALPEALYAGAASAGAVALLDAHPRLAPAAHLVGAVALAVVAVAVVRPRSGTRTPRAFAGGEFAAALVITLLNPTLLVTWSAASAPLAGLGWLGSTADAVAFGLGCAAGGFAGSVTLATVIGSQRHRIGERALPAVKIAAAVILGGFAVWLLVEGWGAGRAPP